MNIDRGRSHRFGFAPEHAAAAGILLGGGMVFGSLLTHTSQSATLFGRYSLSMGLVLVGLAVILVLWGGLLLLAWGRWPALIQRALGRLPPASSSVYLIAGAAALVWLWRYGRQWNAIAGLTSFHLGLLLAYMGGAVLLVRAAHDVLDPVQPIRPPLAAASRQALTAALLAIPAAIFALAAGLSPDLLQGLALIPGLLFLVLVALLAPSLGPLVRRLDVSAARRLWPLAGPVLILAFVLVIYHPGFQHAPMGNDELRWLWIVNEPATYARWLESHPLVLPYFRPFFRLQAEVLYRLFGLNYAVYYLAELLALALSGWAVFWLIWRLSRRGILALTAGCLLVSHIYVSDLVTGWVFDTGPLTGALAVVTVGLIAAWRDRWPAGLALLLASILAPLSRENGLAIPGAAAFYGAVRALGRWAPRRRAVWLMGLALLGVTAYFVIRSIAVPGWWEATGAYGEDTGFFTQHLKTETVRALAGAARLQVMAYTVAANLTTNVLPIFGAYGTLWAGRLTAWWLAPAALLALTCVLLVRHALTQPKRPGVSAPPTPGLALVAAAAISLAAFGLISAPGRLRAPGPDMAALPLALHTAISAGMGLGLVLGLRWTRARRSVAWLAAGLILANSLVNFPYFRYRSQYLALVGWVLLLGVVLAGLEGRPWRVALRRALLAAATVLILVNGVRVFASLPLPRLLPANFAYTGLLCEPSYPAALRDAIRERYGLDPQALAACQAETSPAAPFTVSP